MSVAKATTVGIVGCGAISEMYYGPLLAELSLAGEVAVTVLFDPASERVAKLARLFPDAVTTPDLAHVMKLRPDLTIVASPPRFHASQTNALLECGIGVLCEKPMAATVAEAETMIAAAAKSTAPLAIGLFRRFFPVNRTIRDLVRGQHLGAVQRFEISEGGPFQWPAQSASFFQKSGSQGGVLADLGVHVLDLLVWWFGMPEKIRYEDDAMGGLEANCRVELGFAGNVVGTVRLSRDTPLENRTIVECERGWLRCAAASADELELGFADSDQALGGKLFSLGPAGAHGIRTTPADSYPQNFTRQLLNVIAAVRAEEKVFVPATEGALSLRVIEQCYRERQLMPMPWLETVEVARALAAGGVSP